MAVELSGSKGFKAIITSNGFSEVHHVLFRPKVVVFYLNLDGNYVYSAAKVADLTYSHAVKLSREFDRCRLLKIGKRTGRTRFCKMTANGVRVKEQLLRLLTAMNKE